MFDVNRVNLEGNISFVKDPTLAKSGTTILKAGMATNYQASQGVEPMVTWHNLTFLGKSAEYAAAHLKKGDRVYIEGRINNGTYEKDGVKQTYSEVVVSRFVFVDIRKNADTAQPQRVNVTEDIQIPDGLF